MRTPAAIAVIAAGAILSLAVSARVPGVNLRLAGVIIIAAGIAVLLAPPSPAADWVRRRRGHADPAGLSPAPPVPGEPDDDAYPDYLLQDPAVLAAEVLNGIRSDGWPQPATTSSSASASPSASTSPWAGPSPSARTPRAAARPAGRAAGPRPLYSVDLDRGADLSRRHEFG
jgi:hypothetical protein